jgi:hypothetical protein
MNRKRRRAEKWARLNPHLPFDEFAKTVGEDARKIMMAMLRRLTGPDAPFDDRELWDATRELINAGLLKIWFRFAGDRIEIEPEFIIPSDNDNGQPSKGAA